MNKYLLMSAAAVLATNATAASAAVTPGATGTQSVFITSSGITFCDAVTLYWHSKFYYTDFDTEAPCGSGYTGISGVGNGIAGKTIGLGRIVDASNSIEGFRNVQLNFDMAVGKSGPINGGAFSLWISEYFTSFITTFQTDNGHYYFGPSHHGGKAAPALIKLDKVAKVNGYSMKR